MATDPELPLKTLVLDLTMKVMELQMAVRRMEADAERRHAAVMGVIDPQPAEVGVPADLEGELQEWLARSR